MLLNRNAIHAGEQPKTSMECRVVDSLTSAALLAFTGGTLNAFLHPNHGKIYAGVMTGNAVLGGIAVFNHSTAGVLHYAVPIFTYLCGIVLVAFFQNHVKRHATALALVCVSVGLLVASFLPANFPEWPYVFLVVLLTGFLVGIARTVDSYAYNATVLTGSLRDGAIALYKALDPATRAESLRMARDLWVVMLSFVAGAVAGGLLGKHMDTLAIYLPLKALVWEDQNGGVWLSYNTPEYLAERHTVPAGMVRAIAGIRAICEAAVAT